ncbi:MAG: S8 family peptidase [Thermoflexibacteraceae bacterium]
MKKLLSMAAVAVFAFACQQQQETTNLTTITTPAQTTSRQAIDEIIWNQVRQNKPFTWDLVSEDVVWSALKQSDNVLSVGYKPASTSKDIRNIIHNININEGEWKVARERILAIILEEERKINPSITLDKLVAYQENTLPVIDVYVHSLSTIQRLRNSNLVRYAEPMGYEPTEGKIATENNKKLPPIANTMSSSGCGGVPADFSLVANTHFTNIAPAAKASWNHAYHGVANAWTKSSGTGIGVMIIDTGISPTQDNFGTQFNQGLSAGRSIQKLVTLPRNTFLGIPTGSVETPDDACGHGTAMAGVLAAPRGTDGNASGIAYNVNLVTVRATADVFLDESREVKGVSDAYVIAGNRSDIRITSMSLGRITSSSQLADAVRYAYNRGKLIFCAGGTSFGWAAGWWGVIFPATMNEVVAVTGMKENFTRCDVCHTGSEIDFAVVMERNADGKHALTTAMSGNQPATVGGSSVATAQTAGMAALVWARFPTMTRDQVWNKLTTYANYYPNRNGNFGWGAVNVDRATNAN